MTAINYSTPGAPMRPVPAPVPAIVVLAGRLLLSIIFIMSGAMKIAHFQQTASMMTQVGMPAANVLEVCAIALEIGGGLGILLGILPRLSAWGLAIFLVVASYYFHAFWKIPSDAAHMMEKMNQQANFMKNMAILGAMLIVAYFGSGPLSLVRQRPPAVAPVAPTVV